MRETLAGATQVRSSTKEEFETRGFATFANVLSVDQLRELQSACDEMVAMAEKNPGDIFCNYYLPHRVDQGALYDVYQRNPVFRRAAEAKKVIEAIQTVYAEEFYLFENSLVYKPRGAQNEVPWHQDFMYMTNDPDKVIAWIAVDDVTEDNGCMYAIPGSHKKGALPFHDMRGETHHKRTDAQLVDESQAQPLTMKAGDLLVFHQFLLHSSKRVSGTVKRRAYRFAVKSISNSYTPRGTPIILASKQDGALLRPFDDRGRNSFLAKVGRRIVRFGQRLEDGLKK